MQLRHGEIKAPTVHGVWPHNLCQINNKKCEVKY